MKVIITFTFCCDKIWKSKLMALEKPGKLGEFFSPTLWPPWGIFVPKNSIVTKFCHLALGGGGPVIMPHCIHLVLV